jgi:tryptophanyl-tRNA synthetase
VKVVFSGVAPSGTIHLGNYLGAIKNWVELQKENQCIFCVVDLHAITTPQDPEKLRSKIMEVAAIYLAAGIDPEKSIVFIQSHNQDHAELAWILNCITHLGELSRMTQFKEKSPSKRIEKLKEDEITMDDFTKKLKEIENAILFKFAKTDVGLLNYPILMAADILLYGTDIVPVGEDQKQHVELARTLARRFNQNYGEVFKIPQAMVRKEGARIMGLDDPSKKMSKSAKSPANYIALTDPPETIREKIKKAVTDSGSEIKYDPQNKPAISNLLTIYSLIADKKIDDIVGKYENHTSYAEFKKDLAEEIIKFLSPFQKKYNELMVNPDSLKKILEQGAATAKKRSFLMLIAAKNKIGLA